MEPAYQNTETEIAFYQAPASQLSSSHTHALRDGNAVENERFWSWRDTKPQ